MIGLNELGAKGWLGNQMFQYASLKGIAANRGYDFCIPPNDSSRIHNYLLHDIFKLKNCSNLGYVPFETYYVDHTDLPNSCGFRFNETLFNDCPDNVNINGFFQSEKYFKDIRDEILEDFEFKEDYPLPYEEYIALHVRRGDYVQYSQHFALCSVDYYKQAIEIIGVNMPVVVLSDDIAWCRDNIPGDLFIEGNSIAHDLYIMTKASHNIIANSTYSWWGAWLNQKTNKVVVAPSVWFGPALAHQNNNDLIPEEWKTI